MLPVPMDFYPDMMHNPEGEAWLNNYYSQSMLGGGGGYGGDSPWVNSYLGYSHACVENGGEASVAAFEHTVNTAPTGSATASIQTGTIDYYTFTSTDGGKTWHQGNYINSKPIYSAISIPVVLEGGATWTVGVSAGALASSMVLAMPFALTSDTRVADQKPYSYVTYTKYNPATHQIYVGRTEGWGNPTEVLARRDAYHHMNALGFEPAILDRYIVGTDALISDYRWAIRGREQQMIELFGGIGNPMVGNRINGISPYNPMGPVYRGASYMYFGPPGL